MASQGEWEFDVLNELRAEQVNTDQKENDLCGSQVLLDFGQPILARRDLAVIPSLDDARSPEQVKMPE